MEKTSIIELRAVADYHLRKYEDAVMVYRDAVISLIIRFCKKQGLIFDDRSICWGSEEFFAEDMDYTFSEMEYDIQNNVKVGEIDKWIIYRDDIIMSRLGNGISYESYLNGYRPFTQEEINKALGEVNKEV